MIKTVIQKENPDIIMLQEANRFGEKIAKSLGYHFVNFKEKGTLIMSKMPIDKAWQHTLRNDIGRDGGVICGEIQYDGKTLLLCSVHLTNIPVGYNGQMLMTKAKMLGVGLREIFFDTQRSNETKDLVKWIGGLGYENIVIGGDFNSFFCFKSMRIMRKKFSDTAWGTPAFWESSHKWPKTFFPVKIDYIYVTKNMDYGGTKIVHQSPGDHYPVVAYVY